MASSRSGEIWGTWEDLLLASAVARHAARWDSVAAEVRSRTAAPAAFLTADSCRLRFHFLRRRFAGDETEAEAEADREDEGEIDGDVPAEIPWIQDLRRLRVAELRREVERSDASIVSLQLKVNRLKEERERSVASGSESDLKGPTPAATESSPETAGGESESKPVAEVGGGDEKDEKAASCNGSTETVAKGEAEAEPVEEAGGGRLRESGESAAESKEGSDVQSSASLSKRRRRPRRSKAVSGSGGSQPLVAILEMIQRKDYGDVFQRRLESQETARYRSVIKRHVDLEMVRAKLSRGSYENLQFFRDLLLLCTNAIVFFPKNSLESLAAARLRNLVTSKMSRSDPKPSKDPTPALPAKEKESSLPPAHLKFELDLKRPTPIIACKKRSSISIKPAATLPPLPALPKEQKNEKLKSVMDPDDEILAKKISGTKRVRTTKNRGRSNAAALKAPIIAPEPAPAPTPKISHAPNEIVQARSQKKSGGGGGGAGISSKKRGAATFLSRINGKSPTSNTLLESLKGSPPGNAGRVLEVKRTGEGNAGKALEVKRTGEKGDGKKELSIRSRPSGKGPSEKGSAVKRTVGRPPKRAAPSLSPPPAKRVKEDMAAGPSKAPVMPRVKEDMAAGPSKPPVMPPGSKKKVRK